MFRCLAIGLLLLTLALPVRAGLEPDLRATVPLKAVTLKPMPFGRASTPADATGAPPRVILHPTREKADRGVTLPKAKEKASRTFSGKMSLGGVRHPQHEPASGRLARPRGRLSQVRAARQDQPRALQRREALWVQEAPVARVSFDSTAEREAPAVVTLEELNRYVYRRDRPKEAGKPVPITPAGGGKAD